jgi:D-hydroxyproline dehydrogenase subunit gamma
LRRWACRGKLSPCPSEAVNAGHCRPRRWKGLHERARQSDPLDLGAAAPRRGAAVTQPARPGPHRLLTRRDAQPARLTVDGAPFEAWVGESVLVAILAAGAALRPFEDSDRVRAGFCLMGACQDCTLWLEDGTALRGCSTPVADGMRLVTRRPDPGTAARDA